MRKSKGDLVFSFTGRKHLRLNRLFGYVSVFVAVLAMLGLSGCAGVVSGTSTGTPSPSPSPLNITNVQVLSATTSACQIAWTTDVPADSAIDFGTSTTYGSSTVVDPAMVTNHVVTVSGLVPAATYYYQVRSADSKSNHGQSGGHNFKTNGLGISGTIGPAPGGSGATVALTGAGTGTVNADSAGNFAFSGLPDGTYSVTPTRAGYLYSPSNQNVILNGSNATGVNFAGTAQTFSISGTITPIAGASGASVTLNGTASTTTTANASGSYTFIGLLGGSYTVTPTNAGYTFSPPSQSVSVSATNITGVNFTDNSVAVAPTISAQPVSQTVTAGQTASFTVMATGTAPLSYQWRKNGANIAGATAASYITSATVTSDSGSTFGVVVSNSVGSATSAVATLTVNAAAVAPTISTQPANQTVTAGQTAAFTVVATGTAPLSYQWQKNGVNIAGATAASYITPATTTTDSGSTFGVVVSNSVGSVTSAAATLTVSAAPVAPTITAQPANQTVTAGQTATFTVVATGTAPLSYQWQKNGVNIAGAMAASYTTPATTTSDSGSTLRVVVSNSVGPVTSAAATLTVNAVPVAPTVTAQPANQTVTAGQTATFTVVATGAAPLSYQWQKNGVNSAGATTASYTTPVTATSDSGSTFDVVVSNTAGTVTSAAATLTVNAAPIAPTMTTQPTNQTVAAGQTATFTVVATGTAPLTYQWQKNGVNIAGVTSSSYITPATTTADSGSTFRVVVSNTAGTVTSASATLTVNPAPVAPTITTQPASQTVTAGQTATFTVVAAGTAPLSYQWSRSGATIAGATSSSYTTGATTSSDNGAQFTVVVSNTVGSVTSSGAALTVGAASVAPTITTQPASQTVTAGQTATFTVVATGTAPLSYQWSRSGATIAGATSSSYTTGATTSSDNGAQFTVVVGNTVGSVTSSGAALTVSAAPVAPTITTQPTSQTVAAGQTATFTVVATGTAPLGYQWQKNGVNITGATAASYTTPATTTSDNGTTFGVVVSNTVGSVTSSAAKLTVNAPQISVVPTSVSFGNVVMGTTNTNTIAVTNSGSANLTISQATASGNGFSTKGLTLPLTLSPGQSANFNVAFAPAALGGVAGSVSLASNAPTSPTVIALSGTGVATTLLLGANPTNLGFGNVNVGSNASLSTTLTNNGNSNVTISSVTPVGIGFSPSGVTAGTVLTPNQSATLSVVFSPTAVGSAVGSVTVLSNATDSPTIITFSGSGVASTSSLPTCGKLNDTNVYVPPSYDTFALPAKGQSYTDPIFGCKITRITDAIAMGWVEATHFYNTVTPFNADDSYLFLYGSAPIIVDLSGNVVVPQSNMPATNSSIEVWDTTNPKVMYYTNGNQFIKGTISGTPPNATVSPTVLATFTQYANVVIPGDMDISNDGLHIWLTNASSMGGNSYTADAFPVTLNAGSGNATSATMGAVMAGLTYHKLQIVPNNGVSVEGNGNRTIYNPNGTVYEVPGGGTGAHTDWGVDSSGKMVAASIWYAGTGQNGCPSGWGYGLLDLASNSVRLCLNDGIQNVGNASHNSARDTQSGHWVVFSDDDSGGCPSSSYWCFNNSTNMTGWSLYTGEILIWDDAGNTVRLAHHRSRSDESYWAQTRASISRDGKYIVFDSNYNRSGTPSGANYTDVFTIGPLY